MKLSPAHHLGAWLQWRVSSSMATLKDFTDAKAVRLSMVEPDLRGHRRASEHRVWDGKSARRTPSRFALLGHRLAGALSLTTSPPWIFANRRLLPLERDERAAVARSRRCREEYVGLSAHLTMHQVDVDWCTMKSSHSRRNVTSESVRASVSFPAAVYAKLERIAVVKKVSLAWVVRDAAEKYISGETPLPRIESRVTTSAKSSAGRKG